MVLAWLPRRSVPSEKEVFQIIGGVGVHPQQTLCIFIIEAVEVFAPVEIAV